MISYDTVTEAVQELKKRGYTKDFSPDKDRIVCHDDEKVSLKPSEFEITEVYRFEGDSDPADEAIVYAIESKNGHKGILVNGFGISSDSMSNELIEKLNIHSKQ